MYKLDDEGEITIAINLLPLLANDVQNKVEQQRSSQTEKADKSVASHHTILGID